MASRSRSGRRRALSPRRELSRVKKGIADGRIDIVVGTHALLGKAIKFKDLGARHRRRGAALRRHPQGAAEDSCAPRCTC